MQNLESPYCTVDGTQSAITIFRNASKPFAPVVLILPAMGVTASFYRPFAEQLVSEGFHAISADWRGKGLSGVRASRKVDFGYRQIWQEDFPALFDHIRSHFPVQPIIVYGHSLGGQLSSLYLAAHPEKNVAGVVLHMACHCDYRNWEKDQRKLKRIFLLYPIVARLWGYFPGHRFKFARREARTFMRDWGHSGRRGKYHPRGMASDYDSLATSLHLPILAFSLENDWLAPKKAVEHLCGLFSNASVRHWHLDQEGHGDKPLSHFNWVYHPAYFIRQLKAWSREEVKLIPTMSPISVHSSGERSIH